MPPTLKKLVGHIAFGLFVYRYICTYVTLFYAFCNFSTIHGRVLKFHTVEHVTNNMKWGKHDRSDMTGCRINRFC